jgi:hypothetical protein
MRRSAADIIGYIVPVTAGDLGSFRGDRSPWLRGPQSSLVVPCPLGGWALLPEVRYLYCRLGRHAVRLNYKYQIYLRYFRLIDAIKSPSARHSVGPTHGPIPIKLGKKNEVFV